MIKSPMCSPAAETTTPPQTSGPAAPRPSPPGPMSPASLWLHNHAYHRHCSVPSRFPSICRCQGDGADWRVDLMSGLVDTMVADRIADGTHDAWVTRDPAEDRGYERFGD